MDTVRHVRDRDVVSRHVVEERPPHLAGDLAVQPAHAVGMAGEPQRKRGHPRPFVASGTRAAEIEETVGADPEPPWKVGEGSGEGVRVVRLVPCGHGRVGREHAARACLRERRLELLAAGHPIGRKLERSQRRMSLVEVEHARLDPEHPQRSDRAHAEEGVLAEARQRVALVEPGGDPAVDRVVLVELGIEEVERHPTDLRPPDVEGHRAAVERELSPEWRAVVVEHLDGWEVLGDTSASSTRAGSPSDRLSAGSTPCGREARRRPSAARDHSPA